MACSRRTRQWPRPSDRHFRRYHMSISSLFDIKGKTALVTGGSRGIGLMIARGFVEAGVKTYISSRKAEACERAAKELSKIGECIPLAHDLASTAEVHKLADEVKAREKK